MRFLCFGKGSLTSLYDRSDGFYRRQLILTTKERPADRKDDPFLVEKMLDELEGIFLWCLEGLLRLIANGYGFTVSNRSAENVELIRRSNNNIDEEQLLTEYEANSRYCNCDSGYCHT